MRENSTTTAYYLYAREDRIADYDRSGNLLIAYTHGPGIDEPVAMTLNNSTYFYIPDIQGTIRAMVDMDGNTVATYQYDAWGNLVSYGGSLAEQNDYLYTGREYDWQTGIYYYRYRYYNPEIGRFMQSSWEHTKEMNMYVYVNNDPANHEDPTGHPFTPPVLPDHGGGCQFFSYQCRDPRMRQLAIDKCGQCPPPLECWCDPYSHKPPESECTACKMVVNFICRMGGVPTCGLGGGAICGALGITTIVGGIACASVVATVCYQLMTTGCMMGAPYICQKAGYCSRGVFPLVHPNPMHIVLEKHTFLSYGGVMR